MSKYIEKVEKNVYPLIKLENVVIFPGLPTSIELSAEADIAAVNAALSADSVVFATALKVSEKDSELCQVGVVAKVKQAMKLPDGHMRVLVEGKKRAELSSVHESAGVSYAEVFVRSVSLTDNGGVRGELLVREAISQFQEFLSGYHALICLALAVAFAAGMPFFHFLGNVKNPFSKLRIQKLYHITVLKGKAYRFFI